MEASSRFSIWVKLKILITIIEAIIFLGALLTNWYYLFTRHYANTEIHALSIVFVVIFPAYPLIVLLIFNYKEIPKRPSLIVLIIFYPLVYATNRVLGIFSDLGSIDPVFRAKISIQGFCFICLESIPRLILQGSNDTLLDQWTFFTIISFIFSFLAIAQSFIMVGIKAAYKSKSLSWIKTDIQKIIPSCSDEIRNILLAKIYKLDKDL